VQQNLRKMSAAAKETASVDSWGFPAGAWHATTPAVRFQQTTAEKDAARDQKWARMVHPTRGLARAKADPSTRSVLKRRWRKGVPRGWRRAAWPELLDHGPDEFRTAAALRQITFQSLVDSPPAQYDEVIEKDVVRTFPRHARFATSVIDGGRSAGGAAEAKAISSLRRILRSYAALDPACGYCQGMNYVASFLLLACDSAQRSPNDPSASLDASNDEERCFWLFVAAARGPRTKLRELYLPSMVGCRRALFTHEELLRKLRPRLAAHLEQENVLPTMYATHWFVTLFSAQFPAGFAARAWDRFLAEGWKPVYQLGVALLAARERELLALDFEGLMGALRRIPEDLDVERTLALALRLRITTRDVRDLEARFGAEEPL